MGTDDANLELLPLLFCLLLASSTQISSVSVALSYYEQYLASPASTSDGSGGTGAVQDGSGARTHRRRFQEKLEEEEDEDADDDLFGTKTTPVGGFVFWIRRRACNDLCELNCPLCILIIRFIIQYHNFFNITIFCLLNVVM